MGEPAKTSFTALRRTMIVAGLLCVGCIGAVGWCLYELVERFTVTLIVENQSDTPIERVRFLFAERTISVGPIAARTTVRHRWPLTGSGSMEYEVVWPTGRSESGAAAGHLDADCEGEDVSIRIGDRGVEALRTIPSARNRPY